MNKPKLPFYGAKIEYDNENYVYENMQLHLEPEQEEGYLEGTILAERLKDKGLSASVLDYLLENPKQIPKNWETEGLVYFWGTIFRNTAGRLYVRYLVWYDDKWRASYRWLDNDFRGLRHAAVSASISSDLVPSSETKSFDLERAIGICVMNGYQVIKHK